MQVKCRDVLVPVPRSSKILVRRQQNYEGPFTQFVFMEQSNRHEEATTVWIGTDQCKHVGQIRWSHDHANTCRPIIRACTGFFDEWEASVNVHVGQLRLDRTFAFSKTRRAAECKTD